MQIIRLILLWSLLVAIFFGEVARVSFGNGIAISLIDIVSGFIGVFVILEVIKSRKIINHPFSKPLFIFTLVCITSLIVNMFWLSPFEILVSFLYVLRFISLASIFFFVKTLPLEVKDKLPIKMVVIATLLTILGFIQYFYNNLNLLYLLDWDIHWYRLFSTFIDPNFMGVFLTMSFFLSLFLFFQKFNQKKSFKSYLYSLYPLIILTGIILTYSRSALIALGIGFTAYFLQIKKNKKIMSAVIMCFILGIGTTLLNYNATEGTKLFRATSSKERITSITQAFTIIKDHPILGVGFNAFRYAQYKYHFADSANWLYSHSNAGTDNSFLFVLATTGIVGFCSFVFLLFTLFRKVKSNQFKILSRTTIIVISVGSLFVNSFFYPFILVWMWMIFGIIENNAL